MGRGHLRVVCCLLMVGLVPYVTLAQPKAVVTSMVRFGAGYREDNSGWICLHLKGKPREIGLQYGQMAAPEIEETNRALRVFLKNDTDKDWDFYREAAHRLFWKKLDPEYQEELEGMSAGLRARGVTMDVTDVLTQNAWMELAWYYLPVLLERQKKSSLESKAPPYCSAFIATGSATNDGKIVMAHNAWIHYIIGQRWNPILDVRPTHGCRILMDSWPGLMYSGDDFAINSAGILITETTIGGFVGFDDQRRYQFRGS